MNDNQCIKDLKKLFPNKWLDLDYKERETNLSRIRGISDLFKKIENNESSEYSDEDRIDFLKQFFDGNFENFKKYGFYENYFSYSDQIGEIFFNSLKEREAKAKALQCCHLNIIGIASEIIKSNNNKNEEESKKLIDFIDICVKAGVKEKVLSEILLNLPTLNDDLIERYFNILGSGETKYPLLQHNLLLRAKKVSTILNNFSSIPYNIFWNHQGQYKDDYLSYLSINDLSEKIIRIENGWDDDVNISADIMADKSPSKSIIKFIEKTNNIKGSLISSYRFDVVKLYGGDNFLSLLNYSNYYRGDLTREIQNRLKKGLLTETQAVQGIIQGIKGCEELDDSAEIYMCDIGKILTQRAPLIDLLNSMNNSEYIYSLMISKHDILTYDDIYNLGKNKLKNDYERRYYLYRYIPGFDITINRKIESLASELCKLPNDSDLNGQKKKALTKKRGDS